MAKTLSEELLALLDDDGKAKVRAALQSKPELIVRDSKAGELLGLFYGEDEPVAATAAHVPSVPSAAATTAAPAPVVTTTPVTPASTSGTADGMAAVLAELKGLKDRMDKDYVPAAKLPEYRRELLTQAISASAAYDEVRDIHREEFKERLDFDKFKAFVESPENFADGRSKFPSMKAAHDVFVAEKRTVAQAAAKKADIDAAVAEALKQQRSSNVPGQTQSIAQSPAQQVMAKAKAGAHGDGAESAAMRAARQMEELDRSRASVQ